MIAANGVKKDVLTKGLAISGTALVWLPLLAPVLFSAVRLIQGGHFLFDFLMPAELFPLVLVGGLLLLWAAFRARMRRAILGWGLGAAVVLLVGSQALAVVTGLASGETELGTWQGALVIGLFVLFLLAVVAIAIGSVLLVRDLFGLDKSQI